jgi:hypothetical protein
MAFLHAQHARANAHLVLSFRERPQSRPTARRRRDTFAPATSGFISPSYFIKNSGPSRFERKEAEAGEVTQSLPLRSHQPSTPAKPSGKDVTTVSRSCSRAMQRMTADRRVWLAIARRPRNSPPGQRLRNALQREPEEEEAGGARPSSPPAHERKARPGPGPQIPSW